MNLPEFRAAPAALGSPIYINSPNVPLYPEFDPARNVDEAYYKSTYVFAAVDRIATSIARCPFRAGKDTLNPASFSEAAQLAQLLGPAFPGPAPGWAPRLFWKYTCAQYILTGKFAWLIERDPATGRVVYLWPLEAQFVYPKVADLTHNSSNYFCGYQYGYKGKFKDLSLTDVVYCWNPSKKDRRQPESWIDGARLDISTSQMLDLYNYALLKNNATPSTLIGHEPFAEAAQRNAFREQFARRFGGPSRAGSSMFIEFDPDTSADGSVTNNIASKLSVQRLGLTPTEFMSVEMGTSYTNDVTTALKTPLSVLGDSTKSKFQNADQDYRNWWRETLVPLMEELSDQINVKVVPLMVDKTFFGWFDTTHVRVLDDANAHAPESVSSLHDKRIVDRDEARHMLGLPAWDSIKHPVEPPVLAPAALMPPALPAQSKSQVDQVSGPPSGFTHSTTPNHVGPRPASVRHAGEGHEMIQTGHRTKRAVELMLTAAVRKTLTQQRENAQQRLAGRRSSSSDNLSELFNAAYWEQRTIEDLEPVYAAISELMDVPTSARKALAHELVVETARMMAISSTIEEAFANADERTASVVSTTLRSFELVPIDAVSLALDTSISLDDAEFIRACSLDTHPGSSNWVESSGGLPSYICEVAKGIMKSGHDVSSAIAIAVSRMKVWATGKGVNKDTQAKAVAALAEWTALKAKSHAKKAVKK